MHYKPYKLNTFLLCSQMFTKEPVTLNHVDFTLHLQLNKRRNLHVESKVLSKIVQIVAQLGFNIHHCCISRPSKGPCKVSRSSRLLSARWNKSSVMRRRTSRTNFAGTPGRNSMSRSVYSHPPTLNTHKYPHSMVSLMWKSSSFFLTRGLGEWQWAGEVWTTCENKGVAMRLYWAAMMKKMSREQSTLKLYEI